MRRRIGLCTVAFACAVAPTIVRAEALKGALARAYANSPALNQQRAGLRALDENIPKARAGFLPKVSAGAYAGPSYVYQRDAVPRAPQIADAVAAGMDPPPPPEGAKIRSVPRGYGVSFSQSVFDGFATVNTLRQAESQVFQGREDLRTVEQDTLLGAATAYLDVLRDAAVLQLRTANVEVLKRQVAQTRSLGSVGQVTETDIAQAEAALQQGRTDYFASRSVLQTSRAIYRQIVGVEPNALRPAPSVEAMLPAKLTQAIEIGEREHPAIAAALHAADAASAGINVAKAALYPTASIVGAVNRDLDAGAMTGAKSFSVGLFGQINVPLYQGGMEYASIRQAKELAGQSRLMVDLQRNQVRADLTTAWGRLEAAKPQISATRAAVTAAEVALAGVRGEALVGQRTTFDILVAQQNLLNTRVAHVQAQRDRIVASYAILAAIGRLSASTLGLEPGTYDPTIHYKQVKGRLFGTEPP